jgi:hypothetical protein
MTKDVYDQQNTTFKSVSVYVVLSETGEHVASVRIKYGARCLAYTHFIGVHLTRGSAGGGGYDKETAAVYDAFAKSGDSYGDALLGRDPETTDKLNAFRQALTARGGYHWYQNLESAGYKVIQAL